MNTCPRQNDQNFVFAPVFGILLTNCTCPVKFNPEKSLVSFFVFERLLLFKVIILNHQLFVLLNLINEIKNFVALSHKLFFLLLHSASSGANLHNYFSFHAWPFFHCHASAFHEVNSSRSTISMILSKALAELCVKFLSITLQHFINLKLLLDVVQAKICMITIVSTCNQKKLNTHPQAMSKAKLSFFHFRIKMWMIV